MFLGHMRMKYKSMKEIQKTLKIKEYTPEKSMG
jgi:hypothetical protein